MMAAAFFPLRRRLQEGKQTMETVTNPHDKIFKEIWSDTEHARAFLRHYLPAPVQRLVDFTTLEIAKDSFVDDDLREYFSDILYQVQLQGVSGYVYLLFEHKSFPERFVHVQLLEYMVKIWKLWLKQQADRQTRDTAPRRLPMIVPMVLYHGEYGWTTSTRFADLLSGPTEELAAYIPDFDYALYDLTGYADEDIKGTILARVVMLLFKHLHDPDMLERLPGILSLLRDIAAQPNGLRCIRMILLYVFNAIEAVTAEQVTTAASQALGGEIAMTAGEQLRREGEKRGYEQGLLEAIELGLTLKFGEDATQKVMPIIRAMHDLTRLQAIKEALKKAQSVTELQAMIGV